MAASAAVLATVFGLPLCLGTPLVDPDEGLHAAIALEMVERGDWVTPRFLGEPFLDKPILFFWTLAASIATFGPGEFAVKIAGLGWAALGVLATGWFALRLFGRLTGLLAAVFHATMLLPLGVAQVAVHDVALVPLTTMTMLLLWRAASAATWREGLLAGGGAGLALGLAVLAKALVGVVLVGLPLLAWAFATRRLSPPFIVAGVWCLAVAAIVATPWYAAMEAANPGYLHYYFVERHLGGYTTTSQLHGHRPWWYYLPILAGGGLPWVVYALRILPPYRKDTSPDVGTRARPGITKTEALTLLWAWLVVDVLFFSAAGSKLPTYVLPVFPALAMLSAAAWAGSLRGDVPAAEGARSWRLLDVVAFAPMMGLLVAALAFVQWRLALQVPVARWAVALLPVAAWGLVLVASRRHGRATVLNGSLWAMALTVAVTLLSGWPLVAPAYSARELARHFNRLGALPSHVWFFDERVGSFVFYLDARLRADLTGDRVTRARPEHVLRLRQPPPDTAIVVPIEALPRLGRWVALERQPSVTAGHHRVYSADAFVAALREATNR